jgi:beta-glucosidase
MTLTSTESTASLEFPPGFLVGTATASYQIEGAVHEGGRGESIWDRFAHTPGRILNGDTGDVSADHYHRYREDIALMAELGLGAYRFSLAWPRLQPDGKGRLSADGVEFYERLIEELLRVGIRPWVTLYHWDLPQALEDRGGWPARDTAMRFAEYAVAAHERLGDRVADWTTLNEPWCSAFLGYASGHHAPGRTDAAAAVRAAHHLLLGHGIAVAAMRQARPEQRYGLTLNLYPVTAASDDPRDADAARQVDGLCNRLFLDPVLRGQYPDDVRADLTPIAGSDVVADGDEGTIAVPLDFLGVNYYSRHVVRAARPDQPNDGARREPAWVGADVEKVDTGKPKTKMGWEIDPSGMLEVLRRLTDEYDAPPLYITENGAAFDDEVAPDGQVHDVDRVRFLDDHFGAARQAIDDGVDLRGYFVWSLLDNFEWAWGYDRRFGIIHVDFATQQRTVKDSGRWLAGVARATR